MQALDLLTKQGSLQFADFQSEVYLFELQKWEFPEVKTDADLMLRNPFEDMTSLSDSVLRLWRLKCEKSVETFLGPGPAHVVMDICGPSNIRATRYVAIKRAETKRRIAEIFQRKRRVASDIYYRKVAELLFPSFVSKWNEILLKAIESDPEVDSVNLHVDSIHDKRVVEFLAEITKEYFDAESVISEWFYSHHQLTVRYYPKNRKKIFFSDVRRFQISAPRLADRIML